MSRRAAAIAVMVGSVTGLVACGDDDGDIDSSASGDATVMTAAATVPAVVTTENPAVEAAFEFAQCMRDNGIEDFSDPQIRADGDFFLSPPAGVGDEELEATWEECEHLLPPPGTDPGTTSNTDDAAGWARIVPGGDCQCSDGSEFSFWVREANPNKVLFYLQDGGACFSAETCAPDRDLYNTTVDDGPTDEGGMFDFADARNPFADYSVVYVPYCTGDVHLGNATNEYAPGVTVQHKGYVNGTAALDYLAATFPDATEVVVAGESAGALAAPLYGGLASDRLSEAKITVLADGSGAYPDAPAINEIIAAWGTADAIPVWPESPGSTAEGWSFPELFIRSGRHDPDIMFARHDYAYDATQKSYLQLLDIPANDPLTLIEANEAHIEGAGVNLASYIAPGDEHTVLSDGTLYTEEVNGEQLVDWVTNLIEGTPVNDVHCTHCTPD